VVPWNYSFSATVGCNFLGKTRRTVKCIGLKNPKTAIIVDKNRKPKTILVRKNPQIAQDTKTEKPQFLSAKAEKNQTKHWPNLQN